MITIKKRTLVAATLALGSFFLFLMPIQIHAAQSAPDRAQVLQSNGKCIVCNETGQRCLQLVCGQGNICMQCARDVFSKQDMCHLCQDIPQAVCIDIALITEPEHKGRHEAAEMKGRKAELELLKQRFINQNYEAISTADLARLYSATDRFLYPYIKMRFAIGFCQVYKYIQLKNIYRKRYEGYVDFKELDTLLSKNIQKINHEITSAHFPQEACCAYTQLSSRRIIGLEDGNLNEAEIKTYIESSNDSWHEEQKRSTEQSTRRNQDGRGVGLPTPASAGIPVAPPPADAPIPTAAPILAPSPAARQVGPDIRINTERPAVAAMQEDQRRNPGNQRSSFARIRAFFWSSPLRKITTCATIGVLGALGFAVRHYGTKWSIKS